MLKTLFEGLSQLVYPPNCLLCRRFDRFHDGSWICRDCRQSLKFNHPPFCPKCSRHMGQYSNHARCRNCLLKPIHFDFAWAACLYDGGIRKLLHQFKYGQKTLLRNFFCAMMEAYIQEHRLDIEQFQLIIPIPLYPSRLRERGYNQSELLARHLASRYNIDIHSKCLIKTKNTLNQVALSQKERWTNIRGAFRIKHPCVLTGKNVLIVDDLLTTGATVSEAARIIKDSGASTVGVLTLAITA